MTDAEGQFDKIDIVDWKNKTETEEFWCEVKKFTDASGESSFY